MIGGMRMFRRLKFCCLLLALVSLGAQATTYTVTSNADSGGTCPTNCTLRDAIAAASSGSDIIVFNADMTITLASTLTLTTSVTIDATGYNVAVDGNNAFTVFQVNSGTTVQITHLTIQHGFGAAGGGINNQGTLTLTDSTLSGNSAIGAPGAAGVNDNNSDGGAGGGGSPGGNGEGGGIYNSGTLTLIDSTLVGNRANGGTGGTGGYGGNGTPAPPFGTGLPGGPGGSGGNGGSGAGGSIYNSGTLTLVDSTLSGNDVVSGNGGTGGGGGGAGGGGPGGGVGGFGGNGGNGGNGGGGGIDNSSTSTLINSTLSGNGVGSGGIGGIGGAGGGGSPAGGPGNAGSNGVVSGGGVDTTAGTFTFTNTIVADGCAGTQTDGGGNIDTGSSCGFGGSSQSNVSTLNLGALTNNGGPTQTMLPGLGSAAINAIVCTHAPLTDQRNYLRPDPLSIGLATPCDVGAVEVGSVLSDRIFADGFGPPPIDK
jgi:CSLREA domain-containing protein